MEKLGINKKDNPYMIASDFIDKHDLNPVLPLPEPYFPTHLLRHPRHSHTPCCPCHLWSTEMA
eukprot:456743-Rhodomonas_salina.1